MKVVLEFGVRGGQHVDNLVIPSAKLAAQVASNIVATLTNKSSFNGDWIVSRKMPRKSWTSSEHFVSVTVLDGIFRGPAAATLWHASR